MRRLKAIFSSVFKAMKGWVVTLVTAKKHKSCSTRMYVRARESDVGEEMVLCKDYLIGKKKRRKKSMLLIADLNRLWVY